MMGPAWGYSACGRARVFDDGVLPDGWHPAPVVPMTSEEATKAHECEVREKRGVSLMSLGSYPFEPPSITPAVMAEAKAVLDELAPKKRGRPRKVA